MIEPASTLVIAAGLSNGGGAALRAAEQDRHGLIDGVVASEPAAYPVYDPSFVIRQGDQPAISEHSRSIVEVMSVLNVYQACASLHSPADPPRPPQAVAASAERCRQLADLGMLQGATVEAQAADAQQIINAFGIGTEQNWLQPLHHFWYFPLAIAVTYANAYGRFGVIDRLAGYSFALTAPETGSPVEIPYGTFASLYWTSNGTPPHPLISLSIVNDAAPGGAKEDRISTPDQNLVGALTLHGLIFGIDPVSGQPLADAEREKHRRIAEGVAEVRATGQLGGKPALMVHGREDAILFPNHTARAYYGRNQTIEGEKSRLRYYEVTHAHHLDAWNAFYPELAAGCVPLHYYFLRALDLMLSHLTEDAPLPPSQVIPTTPRGALGVPLTPATLPDHLPPITDRPGRNRITFGDGVLTIPEGSYHLDKTACQG